MKSGEQLSAFAGQFNQLGRFRGRVGERLVDHHVFVGAKRLLREVEMRVVGRGDHDDVNFGAREGFVGAGENRDVGMVSMDFGAVAGNDLRQPQAGYVSQ